jgi:drug/metabolite transporter (DMT)-like permease
VFAVFMIVWGYGYMASIAYIPVSLAALLFFTFPLLVGVFAAIAGQERMTILKTVALVVAFAGLALALGPSWASLDWRGVALALTASVVGALAYLFLTPVFRQYDLMAVSFACLIVLGALAYGLVARDELPRSIEGHFACRSCLSGPFVLGTGDP